MGLAGRRLHAAVVGVGAFALLLEFRDVAGVADHPSAGGDEAGAGQAHDLARHFVLVKKVDLVLVVEVLHRSGAVGEHEAVGVQREVALDRPAVAHLHLERAIAAGVDLHARGDEAPVDRRPGQEIVDLGLDGAGAVLDVGFQNAHLILLTRNRRPSGIRC